MPPRYTPGMFYRRRVAEIMSREILTLPDARRLLERAANRHAPVPREDVAVAVLSHRDLLAASFPLFADVSPQEERPALSRISVGEVMHQALIIPLQTPVPEAAQIMLQPKLGCLPVTDGEGRLLGIITEADFARLAVRLLKLLQPGGEPSRPDLR